MMGIFYLGLVIFLTIIFFIKDHSEWPYFNFESWIPFLWLTLSSTRIISIIFPLNTTDDSLSIGQYLEGNIYNRIIFSSLLVIGLIILYSKRNKLKSNAGISILPFLLYLFVLISTLWSTYPVVSFKRWLMIFGHLVMVIIILISDDYLKALEHILRRYFFVIIVFSVLVVKYFKNIGFQMMVHGTRVWSGIMTHKNDLGPACAFAILFFMWRICKREKKHILSDLILLLLSIYLIIRSNSATAIAILLLGIVLFLFLYFYSYSTKRIKLVALLLTIFLGSFLVWRDLLNEVLSPIYFILGRDPSITGRVPLWNDLIQIGNRRLLFGSGYENFWLTNFIHIWPKYTFRPNNAHNGYLDIYLNLGLIGLILFLTIVILSLRGLARKIEIDRTFYGLYFIYFVMILINNITETFFLKADLHWFLLLILSFIGIRKVELAFNDDVAKPDV